MKTTELEGLTAQRGTGEKVDSPEGGMPGGPAPTVWIRAFLILLHPHNAASFSPKASQSFIRHGPRWLRHSNSIRHLFA